MLQYLPRNERADIKLSINQLAHNTNNHKLTHDIEIKRIYISLKGNIYEGIIFKTTDVFNMDCYVDAKFVGLCHVENNA